jgi:long-chain acyl-CoA synthetase
VEYILKHSEARLVFMEDKEQLTKVHEVRGNLPALQKGVLLDGKVKDNDPFLESFARMLIRGKEVEAGKTVEFSKRLSAVSKKDIATICYTSGTTGPPKGVVLLHKNILAELEGLKKHVKIDTSDETLLFLPLAHIFARTGLLGQLAAGQIISFAGSIDTMLRDIAEIKPTYIFSVPRIYEKIHTKIISGVESGSLLKKQIFAFSVYFGRLVSGYKQRGKWVPPWISIFYQMAEMLVFNKVRRLFGGKLRFCISGGAPIAKELAEFFHAAGILILEGYGLTENAAGACMNQPENYRFGTVGKPFEKLQVKIASDGEILLKGDILFKEYFKNPSATAESIVDGWFNTGDIGEFDPEGYLKITDRKKDLIVTSGGKNVAPQNIENMLKGDMYISQAVIIGDKRNFLTALITLNEEQVVSFAREHNIEYGDVKELYARKEVYNLADNAVKSINNRLPSYMTIKRFSIMPRDFEIGEELTPTLKVKRKFIMERYKNMIDSLYKEGGA